MHREIFAEMTYHAAYEPQRAIRTERYKYMRRFDNTHPGRVLANVDDGPTKETMIAHGWADLRPPVEALYDLALDPARDATASTIPCWPTGGRPPQPVARLDEAHRRSPPGRPGPAPAGTFYNTVDQISPSDPTIPATTHSTTLTRRPRRSS